MGIELPSELAGVAAAAGVRWPQADEEAMRVAAQAWRQAGSQVSTLTSDAHGVAAQALDSVQGTAGDAARQHWHAFVEPDVGHLTATAQGCAQAADRLDHAAQQVGAAKVEIVGQLVNLAQHSDAAHLAAAAGHPTALAGLDTALRSTAAQAAQVHDNLARSIGPGGTPLQAGRPDQVTASGVSSSPGGVPTATPGVAPALADTPGLVGHVVAGRLADPVDLGHAPVVGELTGSGPVPPDPSVGLPINGPGGMPAPVQPVAPGWSDPSPTPPLGHTVSQSAAAVLDRPEAIAPPTATPSIAAEPIQADSGMGGFPSGPAGPVAGGPVAGGAAAGPVSGGWGGAPAGSAGAPNSAPGPWPGQRSSGVGGATVVGAPAAGLPGDQRFAEGARSGALLPLPTGDRPWGDGLAGRLAGSNAGPRDPVIALFLVHLFPIGHLPVASGRPARQLPPPPVDSDYAAGLRFPPHDHPCSDLIETEEAPRRALDRHEPDSLVSGVGAAHARVRALAESHDPLGGGNEVDWDRRYVVRAADAVRGVATEYAWPPGELFPEGGCDAGEAVVLEPGTWLDRFGTPEGRVFAADGTWFAGRALPPELLTTGYHRYQVRRALPAWRTLSAPWFAQPGGGVRYRAVYPAADLVALGYLTDVAVEVGVPEVGPPPSGPVGPTRREGRR